MLWLYRVLFLPALLVLAPRYLLRMRRRGGYGDNFRQRFGFGLALPPKRAGVRRLWLQAVSVGEVLAIAPLLEAWRRDPAIEVYLTTTTSTGYQLACDRYRGGPLAIGYFPIDWWLFSWMTWRRVQPDLAILTEGERWPEHLCQARGRGVPVLCINARLTDRSFRRMRALRAVVQPLIGGITRLLPASREDEQRFRELGFPSERLTTTGNIKLDVTIPLLADAERVQLRRELGLGSREVLLGSSTWPGEEEALVATLRRMRAEGIEVALLIVPRHAERRRAIEAALAATEFSFHFRSRGAAAGEVDVVVADTTGELRRLTQLAEVVFIGKSLPPHHEGQTPIEAAALEKPMIFGAEMTNFRAISRELLACHAARAVRDADELAATATALLHAPTERAKMAAAAHAWHLQNQGAVERTLAIVREELGLCRDARS